MHTLAFTYRFCGRSIGKTSMVVKCSGHTHAYHNRIRQPPTVSLLGMTFEAAAGFNAVATPCGVVTTYH